MLSRNYKYMPVGPRQDKGQHECVNLCDDPPVARGQPRCQATSASTTHTHAIHRFTSKCEALVWLTCDSGNYRNVLQQKKITVNAI